MTTTHVCDLTDEACDGHRDALNDRSPDPHACPARPPCTCDGYGEPEHPCQEHETEYIMTHAANRVDPECGYMWCRHCKDEV